MLSRCGIYTREWLLRRDRIGNRVSAPRRPLNIFRVTRNFRPGSDGLSTHVHNLTREQARRGHLVLVLQPDHETGVRDEVPLVKVRPGPFPVTTKIGTFVFALTAAFRVLRLARESSPDVIHCHGDVIEVIVLRLVATLLRVPLVLTLHAGLSQAPAYSMVARVALKMPDRLITVGPEVAEDVLGFGVRRDRISVITSGIDFSFFADDAGEDRQTRPARSGSLRPVVVSVGRLHPLKGFDVLLDALTLRPQLSIDLLIVGEGPLRPQLEEHSATDPRVQLVGHQDRTGVREILQSADIFVLASVDIRGQREGTPTAVMEAMASGLPLVVSDSGGAQHLVRRSGGGLVFRQGDAGDLARAIDVLVSSPELRRTMGLANQLWAAEKDWSTVAQAVTDVLQRAVAIRAGALS